MLQDSPMYAYIPAKDLARARKFYEEKLGFKPKQEIAGGVAYACGKDTACFLYPTPNDSIFIGGGAKAAWFKDSEGNTMAVIQGL